VIRFIADTSQVTARRPLWCARRWIINRIDPWAQPVALSRFYTQGESSPADAGCRDPGFRTEGSSWLISSQEPVLIPLSAWVDSRSLRSPGRLARLQEAPGRRPAPGLWTTGITLGTLIPWVDTSRASPPRSAATAALITRRAVHETGRTTPCHASFSSSYPANTYRVSAECLARDGQQLYPV
jgi:hypothetical protein